MGENKEDFYSEEKLKTIYNTFENILKEEKNGIVVIAEGVDMDENLKKQGIGASYTGFSQINGLSRGELFQVMLQLLKQSGVTLEQFMRYCAQFHQEMEDDGKENPYEDVFKGLEDYEEDD